MPPKSTRSAKKQARNCVCAIEIPRTPEAEIFVSTKITESESILIKDDDYDYNYPCAQPPVNDPRYEKMFGRLLGWESPTMSKDKGSSSKSEEGAPGYENRGAPSSLPIPPTLSFPLSTRAETKTPSPLQYSAQAIQTTPSLQQSIKRQCEEVEEGKEKGEKQNTGLMVCNGPVHVKYFIQVSCSRHHRRSR